ncbi:MAG: hypothetical protein ACYC9O_21320 [Candidatus Latescibacterota bacterium]
MHPIRVYILLLLAAFLCITGTVSAEKPTVRFPVIFSFDWPISGATSVNPEKPLPADLTRTDLKSVTMIDVGPRKHSFPPSLYDTYDPALFRHWKKQGVLILRRGKTLRFSEDGQRAGFYTTEQLVEGWSRDLEEPGVDGIAIDEFYSHDPFLDFMKDFDPVLTRSWVRALKQIREKYPDKLIICWMWGWGEQSGPILQAFREYADFFVPEIYIPEKDAAGFPNFPFSRFRESVDLFERLAPGISQKTIIGLGFHEKLYDTDPKIPYGEFMAAQLKTIMNDPVLRKLPGVAVYKPAALSPENLKRLDALLSEYKRAAGR